MTPTANLSVFSGTRASGRCTARPTTANAETRRYRAGAGGNEHSATGTHRNHDEHHFKSFEKDRLEGRDSRDPVEPRLAAACLFAQFRGLGRERRRLIVERDDARRAQDRLSQPPHAEQQEQDANDELQEVQRHMIEQRPERDNNEHQHRQTREDAKRLPAASRERSRPPARSSALRPLRPARPEKRPLSPAKPAPNCLSREASYAG